MPDSKKRLAELSQEEFDALDKPAARAFFEVVDAPVCGICGKPATNLNLQATRQPCNCRFHLCKDHWGSVATDNDKEHAKLCPKNKKNVCEITGCSNPATGSAGETYWIVESKVFGGPTCGCSIKLCSEHWKSPIGDSAHDCPKEIPTCQITGCHSPAYKTPHGNYVHQHRLCGCDLMCCATHWNMAIKDCFHDCQCP